MTEKTVRHNHIADKQCEGGMLQNHMQILGDERRVILRIPMSAAKSGGIE